MAKRRARTTKPSASAPRALQSDHYKRITKALSRNRGGIGGASDIKKAMRTNFYFYYVQSLIGAGLVQKAGRDAYKITAKGRAFAKA